MNDYKIMKIYLPFDFPDNPRHFMRRAGYGEFNDPNTGIASYTKRLGGGGDFYPRFHAYVETDSDNRQSINLHLDQKKPSYAGAHAHNADYEGGRVAEEGNRLSGLVKNAMDNAKQGITGQTSDSEERKGFWAKLFKND